jgi:hypothetical protein
VLNRQQGPEQTLEHLGAIVSELAYKPGWSFWLSYGPRDSEHLSGSLGLTFCIRAEVPNSFNPEQQTHVLHLMAVPPANWDRRTWTRWALEQVFLVEQHEAMEFFAVGESHPYFPAHGPGADPYEVRERV